MPDQPPPPASGTGQDRTAPPQRAPTRRRLLRLSWIAAICIAVGGQLWLLVKLFLAPLTPGEGRGQFALGPLEQFPVGSVTHFRRGRFFLIRHATGVLALADECTHQKCTVGYVPERQVIFCPCHSAQFSVTGAVLAGPAPRPLDLFATILQDGHVIVDTTHRSAS